MGTGKGSFIHTFAAELDPTPLVAGEETGSSGLLVASASPSSSRACGPVIVVCVKLDLLVPVVAGSMSVSGP